MAEAMQAARRIRDEADARACLAAVEGSGMRLYPWARANGVAVRSLGRWRERVALLDAQAQREAARARRATGASRPEPRLVEVTSATPREPAGAARYDVVVGRYRVVVGDDFADGTLARLLRVVASC